MKYSKTIKNNPKDSIVIEVGDSKQEDFKPQFKLMRWDNECNFSIRAQEHKVARVIVEDNKTKYVTPEYEVHMYEHNIDEEGGFEFEWLLPAKPTSNIITSTIQTKGLDFFYQPPLTKQEIEEGNIRDERIIGSYAVYHKTKAGNYTDKEYRAGKAFHIYRPQAIDGNGKKVWCDLNIDVKKGILTVTIPQKFLDEALYPILVDPTFGYTTAGASYIQAGLSAGRGSVYAGSAGTLSSITAYCKPQTTYDFGVCAYNASTLAKIESKSGFAGTGDNVYGWHEFSGFSSSISAINYLLVYSGINLQDRLAYDAGTTGQGKRGNSYLGDPITWTNPFVINSSDTNKYSIYATYTAGSSSSIKTLAGVAQASIKVAGGVAIAGVKRVAGVANA